MTHADTRDGRRRDSDLLGLACPRCGAFLTVCQAYDALGFTCVNGHSSAANELLADPSTDLTKPLTALLGRWEQRAFSMAGTEAEARGRGRLDIAKVFRRNIVNLQARIKSLRDAFDTLGPKAPAPTPGRAQPPAGAGP